MNITYTHRTEYKTSTRESDNDMQGCRMDARLKASSQTVLTAALYAV